MTLIKSLRQLRKEDASSAGGKGASLGELTRAGFPVPPGFVISAEAFSAFLSSTGLDIEIAAALHRVNHEDVATIERASEKIRALMLNRDLPRDLAREIRAAHRVLCAPLVAVRSSATAEDSASAAWAGQLESFLNTTSKTLLDNVKCCWASLYSPRAIFYRFEMGLRTAQISVAVVVQTMVQSKMAGIAFSVHPVTQDPNQLLIEAGLGLGEAVVSGQITPDNYVLEKRPLRLMSAQVATQTKQQVRDAAGGTRWTAVPDARARAQKLTSSGILELANLVLRIEARYGFPVDVEWARDRKKFYIVQCRPITTLADKASATPSSLGRLEDYARLFQVSHLPFLVNDLLVQNYKGLRCVFLSYRQVWTSYLPNAVLPKTSRKGLALYGSTTAFRRYKRSFESYTRQSDRLFLGLLKKRQLGTAELDAALAFIIKFHGFYMKTEFFYTDEAFRRSARNRILKQNLAQLDRLKNAGRAYLNKIFFGKAAHLNRLLKLLARQTKTPVNKLWHYSCDELLHILRQQPVPTTLLKARERAFVTDCRTGRPQHLTGQAAEAWASALLAAAPAESSVLRGVGASPGMARGPVKVFSYGYKDFDALHRLIKAMKQGDILVAETTSPELLPACKKASAILTNQGGLLSHAAIVSRELGIPCIVGLGNATQTLHDGELVEVDATAGSVRILKRHRNPARLKY